MDNDTKQHLARLRSATTHRLKRTDLSKWVAENTFMNGKPMSYKNHEFQSRIMDDPSQEITIVKSAQMGISEMAMRMALAMVMTMPDHFAVGYVFPTASFSQQYSKTRFDPIVQGSPALRAARSSEDISSSEVSTFGPGRQIYFKGASSGNSAISTSLSAVFFDEFSFMDQQVAGDYTSRLIHSEHKIKVKLSTPTWPGDPIDLAFQASKRWRNFCKCHHCSHYFYPEFYANVSIPGYSRHLDEVTADNLHTLDYRNAKLLCPNCGKEPSLQPQHREWVCDNPDENFIATGYKLSPFDAPNVITIPYLIEASTSYADKAKFRQFNLGEPSIDADSGFSEEDLDKVGVEMGTTPFSVHIMGIDVGKVSHFVVGGMGSDRKIGIVHYERVPLANFRERYIALKAQYRVTVTVIDQQPYADLVMSLQSMDPNLWSAMFVVKNGLELFELRQKDENTAEAQATLREVNINRNALLDRLMLEFREDRFWVAKNSDWKMFKKHLMDQKRVSAALRNGTFHTIWQKSARKLDHYHMAVGYLFVASQMRGVASGATGSFAGVSTFKQKEAQTPAQIRGEAMQSMRW